MSEQFGLPNSVIAQINNVFHHHDKIEQVIVYGSRAKGNFKPGSDIDLTLIGKELSVKELLSLLYDLDELLLPYKFDISIFDQIENPELIGHIKRAGKVFYQK